MKKVLVAYVSRTGKTEKMAEFIAEGIRFSGNEAVLKKVSEIKSAKDLAGYDGYAFGCPTYPARSFALLNSETFFNTASFPLKRIPSAINSAIFSVFPVLLT